MLKYFFSLLIFSAVIKDCQAQNEVGQSLIVNKNQLEVFYPNYYYYYRFDKRFKTSLPLLNAGIRYQHFNSKSCGLTASISSDYMRDLKSVYTSGQIAERLVLYPSIGIQKSYFLLKQKIFFSLGVDLVGRIGQLMIFGSSNEFEAVFGYYDLLDVGISIGNRLTYSPNQKLCLSIGLNQSFFPYVYDKGSEFYGVPASPRNVTTLTFGIGLNFPSKSSSN
jgi:hypothetical protein